MDRCWFILRQHHYPPPAEPATPGGRFIGAISLGHIIPSLKGIDEVINTSGPEPFPNNMPIWPSKQWLFKWDDNHERNIDYSANVEVPTVAAPVDVKADAGLLFKRSIKNHWEFDRLDTSIIQPTRPYIDDSLEDPSVEEYIASKKKMGLSAWSLYMVSGLMVARGAKKRSSTSKETGIRGGAGVTVPGVVDDGVHTDVNWKHDGVASFEQSTDFVWAIRLTRISKSLFSSDWVKETFVRGATFNLDDDSGEEEKVKLEDLLKEEGLAQAGVFQEEDQDTFVVLDLPADKAES